MKTYLTRARVVLADQVVEDGAVLVEDGRIAAVGPDRPAFDEEIPLRGAWLLPGLVDLHCDALEKEIEPRPNVLFPLSFAVANADKRNVAAGITTVYHALSFAHGELGVRNVDTAAAVARAVKTVRPALLVDNRVHARYEVSDLHGLPILEALLADAFAGMLSFMDHSPGQGQFKTMEAYRDYIVRTYARLPADAERMAREKIEARASAGQRMRRLAEVAHRHDVLLASHDDDSPERVKAMAELGVRISEFPVTLEAAKAARDTKVATVFGAPNVLRGGSQSGSVRAAEAVEQGFADALCSDYLPAALLAAAFRLPDIAGITLPRAVRMVTRTPALAAGLHDRGAIIPGLRADLIAVQRVSGFPQVSQVWFGGRLVFTAGYA